MPSINDWAAKAARRIIEEYDLAGETKGRIAAIISLAAKPLESLLRESIDSVDEDEPDTEWNERVRKILDGIE